MLMERDSHGPQKSGIKRPYPPEYVSQATLAYLLDISETKLSWAIAKGLLPDPVQYLGIKRWNFNLVRAQIEGTLDLEDNDCQDPFLDRLSHGEKTEFGLSS